MISINCDFRAYKISSKLLQSIHNCQQLLLSSSVITLSIIKHLASIVYDIKQLFFPLPQHNPYCIITASHISSKSILQSGVVITGAVVNFSFKQSNAFSHSLSNSNVVSLFNKLRKGLAIFEKSLMNRL